MPRKAAAQWHMRVHTLYRRFVWILNDPARSVGHWLASLNLHARTSGNHVELPQGQGAKQLELCARKSTAGSRAKGWDIFNQLQGKNHEAAALSVTASGICYLLSALTSLGIA
jgi:hypothetical protein